MVAPVATPAALGPRSFTIPWALYVVSTGMFVPPRNRPIASRSAGRRSAPTATAPTPATTTGRRAAIRRMRTASMSECAGAAAFAVHVDRRALGSRSMCTAPGRPVTAMAAASSGTEPSPAAQRTDAFVAAAKRTSWSRRWCEMRSYSPDDTQSVTTMIGWRSRCAWATPFTALAAPGPRVATHAPSRPLNSAVTPAMIAAAVSVWVSTNRQPDASAAPTTSRFDPPPGTPKTVSTPCDRNEPISCRAMSCRDGTRASARVARPAVMAVD